VIILAAALHYRIKGAFCISMFFGSFVWWCHDNSWPTSVVRFPVVDYVESFFGSNRVDCIYLSLQLVFIYIISLSGLVSSMATLAGLVRKDNTTPRNRWIYVVCGAATLVSGLLSGPPVLISPESAGGIKAGAKTGLSTVVCGILFGLSVFFGPILENIPNAATAPLLITVGVVLFQNVQKLNWKLITDSTPAYVVLFFIPFTYSILQGVVIGYLVYLILGVLTGQIFYSGLDLWLFYFEKNPFETIRSLFGKKDSALLSDSGRDVVTFSPSEITGDPDRPRAPSIARIEMDGLEDPMIHLTLGFEELTQETPSYFPTPETFKLYQESHRLLSHED
jgi:xanthine/uracil/vitamin C permease (AzgA family)